MSVNDVKKRVDTDTISSHLSKLSEVPNEILNLTSVSLQLHHRPFVRNKRGAQLTGVNCNNMALPTTIDEPLQFEISNYGQPLYLDHIAFTVHSRLPSFNVKIVSVLAMNKKQFSGWCLLTPMLSVPALLINLVNVMGENNYLCNPVVVVCVLLINLVNIMGENNGLCNPVVVVCVLLINLVNIMGENNDLCNPVVVVCVLLINLVNIIGENNDLCNPVVVVCVFVAVQAE